MRLAALVALASIAVSPAAFAETTTLATNSAWLTLGADNGTVKGCAVQTAVNGGNFTIGGATDRQGILTLILSKSTWTIPNVSVPIVLTFADGEVMHLAGTGVGTHISADVPEDSVKPLIHYFTAESSAVVTLPEGRESPWHLDLHGTTPATLAMAQCVDAAQLVLPAPFRKPIPPVQAPAVDQTGPAAASDEWTGSPSITQETPTSTPPESRPPPAPPIASADASANQPSASDQSQAGPTAPASSDAPPAYSAPAQASSEGESSHPFLIIIGLAAVCGILWKIIAARVHAAKKSDTLQAVKDEIASNARALYVKRLQTVYTDEYGTVQFKKWIDAKEYYITTRIAPIITAAGYGVWPDGFSFQINGLIEQAAMTPVVNGLTVDDSFRSSPDFYDARMHPIDYEGFCAMQLQKAGWDTRTTVASGDQGADVIARQAGKTLVVQCKLYSSSVGNDAVQQVLAAKTFQSAQIAAVVSNQPYTRSAKQLASTSRVYLLHHDELASFRPPEIANGF